MNPAVGLVVGGLKHPSTVNSNNSPAGIVPVPPLGLLKSKLTSILLSFLIHTRLLYKEEKPLQMGDEVGSLISSGKSTRILSPV